jgi:hypothetical protein
VESDIRYYSRRACEEMNAAARAVTDGARERRLQLVDLYLQRLKALDAPSPFGQRDCIRALVPQATDPRSAFAWPGVVDGPRI